MLTTATSKTVVYPIVRTSIGAGNVHTQRVLSSSSSGSRPITSTTYTHAHGYAYSRRVNRACMARKGGLLVSGIASSVVESRNSYSSYSVAGQQYGQVGYTRRFNSTLEPVKNIKENKVEEQYQKEAYKDAEHHAVVSMFDLFSIGIGPSSSHTVGPMRAAKMFITSLEQHGVLKKVTRIKVTLYGSLALTGIGHGTPNAVLMGLEGESPESVETELISQRVEGIKKTETINLGGNHRVKFEVARDLELNGAVTLVQHPNGMRFSVFDGNGDMVATNEYFSIGGGFVVNEKTQVAHGLNVYFMDEVELEDAEKKKSKFNQDTVLASLPFSTGADLLALCRAKQLSIAEIVMLNELTWRDAETVTKDALNIWNVMNESIRRGCLNTNNVLLPGNIKLKRRAPKLYHNLFRGIYSQHTSIDGPLTVDTKRVAAPTAEQLELTTAQTNALGFLRQTSSATKNFAPSHLDYLTVYAIAVNEENAAGGRVVTAPTNGAAGILPAVLKYYIEFYSKDPVRDVLTYLLTSAAIGMLYKRGASISAAEMGCQGEVGVACSMGAAGLAAVMGGTPEQVENAAEIGMEHNLGLTCDPVDGLVQIPCIERNALGAVKAVSAAQLALQGDGSHVVTLDQVIETMRQTGIDMMSKYKETSLGGLAVNVPLC